MWVVDHLEDIESDFAVLHRVDDPLSLPGPEFFRKASRLPAYRGVMRARVEAAQERAQHSYGGTPSSRSGQAPRGAEPVQEVPLAQVYAMHPDLIERRRRRG
jgi:hypothetical protein